MTKRFALLLLFAGAAFGQQIFPCTSVSPYPQPSPVQNDTTTGTSLFKTADLTSSGNAIISPHANGAGMFGVVVAGAGTAGTSCVAHIGPTPLYVDGTTTAGDCIVRSATTDGEGHDTGSACSSNPTAGEFIGIVMTASTGANSLSVVMLKGGFMTNGAGPSTNQNIREIGFSFDGAGSPLAAGTICTHVDYAGAIQAFTMTSDVSGNATVDVQTVSYASWTGPASASSITDSHTPSMTAAVKFQDTTLTGWTTTLTANTEVCFVLSSPATITKLTGKLKLAGN